MRKFTFTIICLIVGCLSVFAENEEKIGDNKIVIKTDTIYHTDTIHVKEVITRTDVILRSEKVVRYESSEPFDIEINIESAEEAKKESNAVTVINVENNIPDLKEKNPESETEQVIVDSQDGNRMELLVQEDLSQYSKSRKDEEVIDLNEKVIFRGDTINMILKDRNLGRFDRGLFNYLFIPKGIWQVGLTASYGEFSTENLEVLDLISDVDFGGKLWSIRPYFSYFIKSNISIGLRLGYTHGKASIGAFNVDIDEDMSFNLHDIMYKSNSYSAAVTFAQYLGIARKGRFGVFNEVELALSGGNSDFDRPYNGELRQTHTTTFQTALNFSPGVCVYVLDQVSFNVSLGVFGLNIKHEKQKVNGEEMGWRTTSGANFRFNIFNINFGIAVNI